MDIMPNIYGYVFAFHLSVKLPRSLYINFTCFKLYEMWWLIGSLPDCCIGWAPRSRGSNLTIRTLVGIYSAISCEKFHGTILYSTLIFFILFIEYQYSHSGGVLWNSWNIVAHNLLTRKVVVAYQLSQKDV